MRKGLTTALTLSAVAALGVTLAPTAASADNRSAGSSSSAADRLQAIGLAGDRTLVRFDTHRAGNGRTLGDVRGLAAGDQELVGIDHRAANGLLYGVGRGGGVYTIDTGTLQATKVLQLTVALQGQFFGVDVNPAADALRIVSDTGQNLRQPLAAPGATVTDTPLNPAPGTGVTGVAYTNNDVAPATATTLFGLATTTDQVVIQAPANAGTLSPTGATGVDLTGDTGFDIYSTVRDDTTRANTAYAVNAGRLYSVDLLTGRFTDSGRIGGGEVTDLSFPLGQR